MPELSPSQTLREILYKNNVDYITLSELKKISKKNRDELGITSKSQPGEIQKKIIPYLGDDLTILEKTPKKYLALNIPADQIIRNYISNHPGLGPKRIAQYLPIKKAEFIHTINNLIESGTIRVTFTDSYSQKLFCATDGRISTQTEYIPDINTDITLFRKAFDEIDNGRIFVRICDLREILGWSRVRFDDTLKKLRDDSVIQLHQGDPSIMTGEEVRNSFIDENHFLLLTITWRKK